MIRHGILVKSSASYFWCQRNLALCTAAPRPRARVSVQSNGSDPPGFTPLEKAALRETADILQQAQEMAANQTRAELMSSSAADGFGAGETAAQASSTTEDSICSFWMEQGLKQYEARRLTQELFKCDTAPSLAQLAAKMQKIERVLPDVDVAKLVCRDMRLLSTPSALMVQNLVALIGLGFQDVISMVARQPSLLVTEQLEDEAQRALVKLSSIHPSGSLQVVRAIAEENPSLLLRMRYYMDASLEELPIEIQNMMVLADHGIGFLYKYYKGQAHAGAIADSSTGRWDSPDQGSTQADT